MSVNVNSRVTDAFYRYKMPKILAKVEGKGNGIKTVLVNVPEVAKALGRPPMYPTKYFGCELGAQTQFDPKNDRYIVNGAHDASKLQDLLNGFISRFVLCPQCENPETVLSCNAKKQTISQSCKACGHQGLLETRHKLTTYILKNPPEVDPTVQGASLTESQKKGGRKGKKEEDSGAKNGDATVKENNFGDDEDVEWSEDVSADAVKKRQEELAAGVKALAVCEDAEKSEKERADIFYSYVKQRKAAGVLNQANVCKDILLEAERLELKEKAPLVLVEVLLSTNILTELKTFKKLFMRFTMDSEKAQRSLLGGIEHLIELHYSALLPKVPHILKALYDEDIVEENVLIDWGNKPSKKFVSKEINAAILEKAKPLIQWLESESSSEEESDLEVRHFVSFFFYVEFPLNAVPWSPKLGV
ncbi:hypothetical protein QYM36_015440 [Artemia franciscana]|uniref:Eukaryotic translation initiation factor 5 n=1 Tax=Artemia franciscana TaxID=6661 RepID=A0AA88HIN3_ARTSF|nr:hypothetical protein QYM36_015440 [Artemia franciscana]